MLRLHLVQLLSLGGLVHPAGSQEGAQCLRLSRRSSLRRLRRRLVTPTVRRYHALASKPAPRCSTVLLSAEHNWWYTNRSHADSRAWGGSVDLPNFDNNDMFDYSGALSRALRQVHPLSRRITWRISGGGA